MSDAAIVGANVELTIEGMVALFFEKDMDGRLTCKAGVLLDAPGHDFRVVVKRDLPLPPADLSPGTISRDLSLVVKPTTGVTFFGGPINRQTGAGAPKSFEWVLDLEGPELYNFDIGAREGGFRSILRIDGGEFFTKEKSLNKLIIFDEKTSSCQNIGIVATKVGVLVNLSGAASSAEFFNGGTSIFKATPSDRYMIEVLRVRQHVHARHGAQHHGDANYFYSALGHKIPPGQKKVFSSTPFPPVVPPVSPEASCLVPRGSKGAITP